MLGLLDIIGERIHAIIGPSGGGQALGAGTGDHILPITMDLKERPSMHQKHSRFVWLNKRQCRIMLYVYYL